MSSFIEEFCDVFATDKEAWEFWKTEEKRRPSNKLIIAGPSRIVGLIDLNKFGEVEWETYAIKSEPTKKMCGNFVYEGGMYSIAFLRNIFKFIGESFEVARVREAILFKLNEDIALGLAEKVINKDFYYDDKGVMFIEMDFEKTKKEWHTVTKAKEFIEWEDNMAKREHKGKGLTWYEEVYRWEKFFEEEEDMGDMMLL